MEQSFRSKIVTRRTYNRPNNEQDTEFETWLDTVNRAIDHQKWLWERAIGRLLTETESQELAELCNLMFSRKVLLSGRTLWLGGTDISKTREASQFSCAFTKVETVYDIVDVLWLLLQGTGVGFRPVVGQLTGFTKPLKNIQVIRSERTEKGGAENNVEIFFQETNTWSIKIGDSAEAWAKAVGKILAGIYPAETLILDFSEIRPAGQRLKGYGWIASGDEQIAVAFKAIAEIMSHRAGDLLTRMDILDIVNWLGTILSSRRSSQIGLIVYGEDEWEEFARAKKDCSSTNNPQRAMSNNSLMFYDKPSRAVLSDAMQMIIDSGGSEPGFINAKIARFRAPWFSGVNPCAEAILGNKSFCNLVEINLGEFFGDSAGLSRAIYLAARANYRQTCVNLRDGVLQEAWHLNNTFLRLCGVGITGIAMRPDLGHYQYVKLAREATYAAYTMADELNLPRPKNVTTVKPSGTLSKVMDTTEGMHKPLGRYIFNNIIFHCHEPVVNKCRAAGYSVIDHPRDAQAVLIKIPMDWDRVEFDNVNGIELNLESAVDQLERYKMLMQSWCQQNVSATISYSPDEKDAIIDWLMANWDYYVGVSFLFRNDPTKTAADLGYPYLPQEVVTKEIYDQYVSQLRPVELDEVQLDEIIEDDCEGGACPVR